jgi:hypothetical protein
MNTETIAENLRNTIQCKLHLLQETFEKSEFGTYPKTLEYKGICDTLETNIDELKCILYNVEQITGTNNESKSKIV